jgi:hypothetical protein
MVETDFLDRLFGLLQEPGWPAQSSINVITALVKIGRSNYHFVLYKD